MLLVVVCLTLTMVLPLTAQQPVPIPPDTLPGVPAVVVPVTPDSSALTPDNLVSDTIVRPQAESPVREAEPAAEDSVIGPPPPVLSAEADSLLRALRALPGFVVTEYQGRNAEYRTSTGTLTLEGDAQVTRTTDRVVADTIVYQESRELVRARGNARVFSETQDLEADSLFYDVRNQRATALGARTQIEQDVTWFVTGDVTFEQPTNALFGSHARFTSCDLQVPHYHFEADQVMVLRDRILVARPARLYFGDVPVMVLPFVVQSLEQGRRSGFLTPRFGINDIVRTSSGYNREISDVGFYWAINEYMGAQVSSTWRSGADTPVRGDLQYGWRRQFLNGSFGFERFWLTNGDRELNVNTQSSWQPDERTNLSMSGRFATSSRFIRDATYDPREQTQDLTSTFSLGRRFDWGRISLGADRRQSIATDDVSMTLPSFSISPNAVTLFRASAENARWYNNASFTPGVIQGSRSTSRFADVPTSRRQDQDLTRLRAGPSFSIGNFTINASGDFNRAELYQLVRPDTTGQDLILPAMNRDAASWSAGASYRLRLIGTSNLSPQISLNQQLLTDTASTSATKGQLVSAPMRMSFGAGLNTDLYGFFPGVGPYSAIRHRFSPVLSYSYSPQVRQTELQERLFGRPGGRTQNRISLSLNQTFEAKLNTPAPVAREPVLPTDSLAGDTIPQASIPSVPSDPQKVSILSINTSPFEYDFIKAREEGNGFVTERVSNTISSDYLRGLQIQMSHDLFDKSELDPTLPENVGRLGRFAPRLSSLSTSFQLGPQSALFQWLERLAFGRPASVEPGQTPGVAPGPPESDQPVPAGQGSFTGNPQGVGGGPWRASVSYQYSRPSRTFTGGLPFADEAVQTLDGTVDFQLTPNWTVNWATSYSITDNEFGSHRLNFRRDIHEWQANFSFYQTPNGNTAFEFYVELLHNQDIHIDYSERDLGIDRRR